ncbi:unnamed protein product [Mucor hiemalis]
MFKFERFGGFNNKKNHIVQFKARDKTLSTSILGVSSPPPPKLVTTYATSNNRNLFELTSPPIKPTVQDKSEPLPPTKVTPATKPIEIEEKKEEDDNVFDFPDIQESKEIKLLVPIDKKSQKKSKANTKKKTPPSLKSSSSSNSVTKKSNKACKKKSSSSLKDQPRMNTTQIKRQQVEEDSIFDIFDFDFNPTVHIRHTSQPNLQLLPSTIYNTHSSIPPFYTNPMASIDSVLLDDPLAFQQVNDFLNETPPPPPPSRQQPLANISNTQPPLLPLQQQQQQQPKKRKRNLVAHLKSASGETTTVNKGFDFLSDEEESLQLNSETSDIMPFREFIQKERSTSPELTYNQRMELELEAMMSSEFSHKKETPIEPVNNEGEKQRRPRYQPQNKLNKQ